MFAAEFEPAEQDGRRRAMRAPVSLDARLGRGGLARALCKVIDLSVHGARVQTYSELKRGSMIWITLPIAGAIAAEIMWASDFIAGCQFRRPLDAATFDAIVEVSGG